MKKRILSGMRPSGKLHVGHYFGALSNWVNLQDSYECYYMIADWHALTSEYADPGELQENISEMVIDWLASGIDPNKSVLFRQSEVKEHAELHLLLSMITPLPWLERCPTYKEQLQEIKDRDLSTYGFLGYPVLQAADILLYKAEFVPVGEDQLPHLELSREIARRFNNFYGSVRRNRRGEILPEPQALLTKTAKLPGVDGRKMSKSYNNAIYLSDSEEVATEKVRNMFTDPQKIRIDNPGHPETSGCVVYNFYQALDLNPVRKIKFLNGVKKSRERKIECEEGRIGCVACKKELAVILNHFLEPFRKRRGKLASDPEKIKKILLQGKEKAQIVAQETMAEVRKAMNL